jgi:hypothetical protein
MLKFHLLLPRSEPNPKVESKFEEGEAGNDEPQEEGEEQIEEEEGAEAV